MHYKKWQQDLYSIWSMMILQQCSNDDPNRPKLGGLPFKTFSTLFCEIWIESQNVLSHQTEKWLFDWPLFIISVSPTKGREKDYDRGTSRTIRLLCLYAGYYTYENTKGISPFDAAFPLFSTYDFWFFIQIFHTMSLMIQRPRDSHAAFIHYQ